MYIPGITNRASSASILEKRRGGGGGRGGGGSSGGRSGGSSGRSGSKSSSSSDRPPPYSQGGEERDKKRRPMIKADSALRFAGPPPAYAVSGGTTVRGATNSAGGGRTYQVRSAPFAGAQAGGGTRAQVYSGRGYTGRGYAPYFPFMFWPIAFVPLYGGYYGNSIYGPVNNSSRPGGELQTYTFLPTWANSIPTNGQQPPQNNAFAIYGDASSVQDLVPIIAGTCSVVPNTYGANVTATPFNAVQYYRDSSFMLALDGYNNSLPNIEVSNPSQNFTVPDVQPAPLPSGYNETYFNCLNQTIGSYVGLLDSDYVTDAAGTRFSSGTLAGSAALVAVLLNFLL